MMKRQKEAIKILSKYREHVWPEIQSYLGKEKYNHTFEIPSKYKSLQNFHQKMINDYPSRKGKYLRPTLLLLTAEAMGVAKEKAIKTAAAMQLSEEWLLVHDDFQDNSLERRGKPALHRIYGNELAVNAGNTLHILMWKILSDNIDLLGSKKTKQLIDEFYQILSRTALGQTTELKWTKENKLKITNPDWFFIADGKTSYYTIAGPMRLGAIIANASKRQLDLLANFGSNLGRCFQLVDDVLDIESDFAGLKKQKGNDIYEGKRTILLGHLIRTAREKDKKKIISIMSKPRDQKNKSEVLWIIKKMHEYGSVLYAKNLAKKLKDQAFEIFEKDLGFLSTQPARSHLEEIINFILERDH
ncbi:MAG: polyprenyl synthetase family protein [Patescibacteria group bacterium]